MNIVTVDRIEQYEGSTLSILKVNGIDMGYCLEDGYNEPKIYGETRIPAGTYRLRLRQEGGFHQRYSKASWLPPGMHKGMIELVNVPNFKYILMHTGNTKEHTHGCLLTGTYYEKKGEDGFFLGGSRLAYLRLYPIISKALEAGEGFKIRIKDEPELKVAA